MLHEPEVLLAADAILYHKPCNLGILILHLIFIPPFITRNTTFFLASLAFLHTSSLLKGYLLQKERLCSLREREEGGGGWGWGGGANSCLLEKIPF